MASPQMKPPTGHVMHGQCVHCKTPLDPHTTEDRSAPTFGALHCPGCRCCFTANGKLREASVTCDVGVALEHTFIHID